MTRSEEAFGVVNGAEVTACTVENRSGYSFTVMSYGATLTSFKAPDASGNAQELTLGYNTLDPYLAGHPFLGSTVGRVANRIGAGRFTYDGRTYSLDVNEGSATLHGGSGGFHQKVWDARGFEREGQAGVIFHMVSEDGDQGFPGTVGVTVTYVLTESNEFIIEYQAEADVDTPLNLTNHAYWNLAGAPDLRRAGGESVPSDPAAGGAVGDHTLVVYGSTWLEQGEGQVPTGRLLDAAGTPNDFRAPKPIGRDIIAADGYDLCYVLEPCEDDLCPAASITEPTTGRRMDVLTTYPTLQFYTAEKLEATVARDGEHWKKRDAFCVETQFHPDAVNHDNFPSIILKSGETYQQKTVHRFSI